MVLPLVPVTPTTSSSRVGSPKKTSAAGAIAARASRTTTCGTGRSSARSTTSATAPRSDRLRREVVAVGPRARHGEEERAGADRARVVGEIAHLDRRAPEHLHRLERCDEALQVHRGDSSERVLARPPTT